MLEYPGIGLFCFCRKIIIEKYYLFYAQWFDVY